MIDCILAYSGQFSLGMRLLSNMIFRLLASSRIHQSRALFASFSTRTLQHSRRMHTLTTKNPVVSTKKVAPARTTMRSTWFTAGLMLAVTANGASFALCQDDHHDEEKITIPPFEESALEYDHYNGVTLHLERLNDDDVHKKTTSKFADNLKQALEFWKAEGRKGIWIHAPKEKAHLIPHCVDLGFSFHFVRDQTLILSQWLPKDTPSKLPFGPTHQVGIGALVFNPSDPTQMLVVQEKSGPAAAYKLWKMPTGLLDPGEDIPEAAVRELKEETGMDGSMDGIVCFRQAHRPTSASDLFFVCRLQLTNPNGNNDDQQQQWNPQEDEIADIQWMSVEDYCNQDRWQGSPVYQALNESIRKASSLAVTAAQQQQTTGETYHNNYMIIHEQLPLGFGRGTNVLFRSKV